MASLFRAGLQLQGAVTIGHLCGRAESELHSVLYRNNKDAVGEDPSRQYLIQAQMCKELWKGTTASI